MTYTEFEQLFLSALQKNRLKALEPDKMERFYRFTLHLLQVNETTNLTAIRNIPDFIDKHLVDSLLVAPYIFEGARVLDLGCGPGFPSIPLAIVRPDLRIVSLDSTAKKIAFVADSAAILPLSNLNAISGRAEDRETLKKLEKFDVVVSRAVARLNVLCELCLPYVKKGGSLLAMKGSKAEEELTEAKNALQVLGACDVTLIPQRLISNKGETEARALIIAKKAKETPSQYPRAFGAISKKPL